MSAARRRSSGDVNAARDAVLAAREVVREWTAKGESARHELDELQRSMGDAVLQDSAAAEQLPVKIQAVRDRLAVAESAAAAAEPRVCQAEKVYLAAEAEALEPAIMQAREALAEHEQRTEQLLAALREHEGEYVPALAAWDAASVDLPAGVYDVPLPGRSEAMRDAVTFLERQQTILRALANGEDAAALINGWDLPADDRTYPACVWGPDALVPASAWLVRVDALRHRVESLKADIERLRDSELHWRDRATELMAAGVYSAQPQERRIRLAQDKAQQAREQLSDAEREYAAVVAADDAGTVASPSTGASA